MRLVVVCRPMCTQNIHVLMVRVAFHSMIIWIHVKSIHHKSPAYLIVAFPIQLASKYSKESRTHSSKLDFGHLVCINCIISRTIRALFRKKHSFQQMVLKFSSGAARRKKKKPTTFVPPPNLNMDASLSNGLENPIAANTGLMSIPFWRRPVARSHTYGS